MSNTTCPFTVRQLLAEVNGEYPNFSQLEARLMEAHTRHLNELPLLTMGRLLEFGRERGWITADEMRVVVAVPVTNVP